VCTPSNPDFGFPADPRQIVNALAAKHGVRPPPDTTGPLQIMDHDQVRQAIGFIRFKSQDIKAEPEAVGRRGSRILRALRGEMSRVRVWGLPDDPDDPDAADFSDVAKSVDHHRDTHSPLRAGGGRHERGA
jgi:hypothetical protein